MKLAQTAQKLNIYKATANEHQKLTKFNASQGKELEHHNWKALFPVSSL